jgi:SAM-dependent methyltransferase
MTKDRDLKADVKEFWDAQSCGEVYAAGETERDYYDTHQKVRYELEPYIRSFAKFHEGSEKDILEIGVGMGSDHLEWAKSLPRKLNGIDLTSRAVSHTLKRLALYGFRSQVSVGDAEHLEFEDESFDLVYSWGVLHHSPNTSKAIDEVHRILRCDGIARVMIYHKYSLTGYMLWVRYGFLIGRPFRSLDDIYRTHLESPGTKAYTIAEARELFLRFSKVNICLQLGLGDLLLGAVGQRHRGWLLNLAKKLWPRWLFRILFRGHGLFMLIEAKK